MKMYSDSGRGWSTTLLNSTGVIYAFGIFNGLTFTEVRGEELKKLSFPPAYPPTTNERYEPSTAIRQYSTGRTHILGLSDDGRIWMWTRETAFLVKPLHVDVDGRVVERVAAGWLLSRLMTGINRLLHENQDGIDRLST